MTGRILEDGEEGVFSEGVVESSAYCTGDVSEEEEVVEGENTVIF